MCHAAGNLLSHTHSILIKSKLRELEAGHGVVLHPGGNHLSVPYMENGRMEKQRQIFQETWAIGADMGNPADRWPLLKTGAS